MKHGAGAEHGCCKGLGQSQLAARVIEVPITKLSFEFSKTFKHVPQGREEVLGPMTLFKVRHKFEHPTGVMLWMRVKGRVPD